MNSHRLITLVLAWAVFATAMVATAQEDPQAAVPEDDFQEAAVMAPVRITFAPPELTGRFVLGVFDKDGFLVRTLMTDETEAVFDIGLNGYITSWDGKMADGSDAPSGHYTVRGYLVGGVQVEGVAYHFNDWAADGDRSWQSIADADLLPDDRTLILVFEESGWTLVAVNPDASTVWKQPLGGKTNPAPILAIGEKWIALQSGAEIEIRSSADGTRGGAVAAPAGAIFAVRGDRLATAVGTTIKEFSLPDGAAIREWELPGPVRNLAVTADGVVAIADQENTELWWSTPDATERVQFDSDTQINALGTGTDGQAVWIAVSEDNVGFVREMNPVDGVLRELKIKEEDPLPVQISAVGNRLGLFHVWDKSTRWIAMERAGVVGPELTDAEPKTVDWTIMTDRKTTDSADFGVGPDGLMPDVGEVELLDSVEVTLRPNPLDPDTKETLVVDARSEDGRIWLSADNGLKLVPVSEAGDAWTRVALVADDGAPEVTLYQGNGWVVEEFLITGLDDIATFDGGTFLLDAGK